MRQVLLKRFAVVLVFCTVVIALFVGKPLQQRYPWLIFVLPYSAFLFFLLHATSLAIGAFRNPIYTKLRSAAAGFGLVVSPFLLLGISNLLVHQPIEEVHLVKYGLLAYFLYAAQRHSTPLRRFLNAFCLASFVGISEETAQIWVPDRIFDYRDMLLNASGCLFGTLYAKLVEFALV